MSPQNSPEASSHVHLVTAGILLLSAVIAAIAVIGKMAVSGAKNTNVAAHVARAQTLAAAAPAPLARPCALARANAAVSPTSGWLRYQDSTSCFTLDYPKGWHIESNAAAVHLWSPQNPHPDSYWAADVIVEKPYDEGSAVTPDALRQKGWTDAGQGVFIGPWVRETAGDGSVLSAQTQERRIFAEQGVFHITLVNDADDARASLLEKIVNAFTAQ